MLIIPLYWILLFALSKAQNQLEKSFIVIKREKGIVIEKLSLRYFKFILYTIFLLVAIEKYFKSNSFYEKNFPIFLSIGITIIFIGLILRLLAIKALGGLWSFKVELKKDHKIIKSGIYKFVNHPAYWGNIYICGITICLGAFYSTLFAAIFIISFSVYRINLENKFILSPLNNGDMTTESISMNIYQYKLHKANKKMHRI